MGFFIKTDDIVVFRVRMKEALSTSTRETHIRLLRHKELLQMLLFSP